jgi:predicted DNA-binding transcriptional regulator YafY
VDNPDSIKKMRHYEPQLFQLTGSIGYLYVRDLSNGEFRNLRMSRITKAKLSDQKAKRLPKKEIKGLKSSFGGFGLGDEKTIEIKIKCDKHMATAFGERRIHDTQKIDPINSSTNLISITIAPTTEIYRLFAGWNDHIAEIKPQNVAEEVKKIVSKAR